MNVPYNGKVNIRLVVKRFKDKTFYNVSTFNNYRYSLKPCLLSNASTNGFPFVRYFKNGTIDNIFSCGAEWKSLFDKFEDAEKEAKRLNSLYFDGFRYKPYLKIGELEVHKSELLIKEFLIDKLLSGFENYNGIDFCNVGAGGTQIRMHHKKIIGYTYGRQITILPDYSNINDVILRVADAWIESDKENKVKNELKFIADGEKYGWD
jgi:hypothetical protein